MGRSWQAKTSRSNGSDWDSVSSGTDILGIISTTRVSQPASMGMTGRGGWKMLKGFSSRTRSRAGRAKSIEWTPQPEPTWRRPAPFICCVVLVRDEAGHTMASWVGLSSLKAQPVGIRKNVGQNYFRSCFGHR